MGMGSPDADISPGPTKSGAKLPLPQAQVQDLFQIRHGRHVV